MQWSEKLQPTRRDVKNTAWKDVWSKEGRVQVQTFWLQDNKCQGFYKHETLKMVRPEPEVKIIETTTSTEYKHRL